MRETTWRTSVPGERWHASLGLPILFPGSLAHLFHFALFHSPILIFETSCRCKDEGLSLERPCSNLVVFVCHCWSSFLRSINSFRIHVIWRVKEIDQIENMIWKIESSLLHACFFLLFFFTPAIVSICLTLFFSFFYFPCCILPLVCLLCLALCVETSGYEIAGWVSETSVCQSLWYIRRPLPCIIDSSFLITVSTVTDEPLLLAASAHWGVA